MSRAGIEALRLLSAPLNVHLLQALAEGPLSLLELRRAVGSPPQSTMRLYSRALAEIGAIERHRRAAFPSAGEYSITGAGKRLLALGTTLERWLQDSPQGPIKLGSTPAKSATKALVEGWSTNIVRALAAKPLSLTDLNRLISQISYPSLERRLGALRLADLVEPVAGAGRGTPYRPTGWLRRAIVPWAEAARWERLHLPGAPRVGRFDVETAFLLTIPLVELPAGLSGTCRLAVKLPGDSSPVCAGVVISVEDGKIVSCSSRLEGMAEAWASGSPQDWMHKVGGQGEGVEVGGDDELVSKSIEALRRATLPVA